MKVVIVGGGIAGHVMALYLHEKGIDCEIYERADGIRELGVGINALPHAVTEFVDLGLLDRLDEGAIRTQELIYTNRQGQRVWRSLCGVDAGYDVPQFSIHRGRLQGVLHRAVVERMGPGSVHTGHRLVGFDQDAAAVTARFADRHGRLIGSARGDVLVAADGIHSTVRETLFPEEGPPRWNGVMMWRGAVDWPPFLTGRSMIIAGGVAAKLVLYPIAEGDTPDTKLTNWALCVRSGQAGTPPPRSENWSRPGNLADFAHVLDLFNVPDIDIRALIAATPLFYEYPMCDRDPLPYWTQGRVTLLGDAAHPMYPMGSNGVGQATLDAKCLADALSRHADPATALLHYQDERLPKTTEVVRRNRKGGPEGVIDEVERRAPAGFDRLENVITNEELEAIVLGYARTAGFAREQVNR
jgi:2-polyprenyl-6-methoxyphenol hydroxylase-like FAD-dependent oxidoreductase